MAANKEAVDAILKKIEDGTQAVFESDRYKAMLRCMAKFHRYSVNNVLLIHFQRPEATLVAGYKTWQTKFHRSVKRGEKGIQILGYAPKTITKVEQKTDDLVLPVYDSKGEPVMVEVKRKIPAYKPMYVFDVSQTEGEPLPTIYNGALEGTVVQYEALRKVLLGLSPMPVEFGEIQGSAYGMMDHGSQRITVQAGLSQVQTIKTLIHEIAHAQMHGRNGEDGKQLSRETKEVEAESVAYVVCQYLNIDTSDYSFPYVAGWAGEQELKVLQASLNRIRTQAVRNINYIMEKLPQAVLEQEQQTPAMEESARASFSIYQIREEKARQFAYLSISDLQFMKLSVDAGNYIKVYTGELKSGTTLESIFSRFNIDRPEDFKGRSLSVSDVVVMEREGKTAAYYCDRVGFQEVPEFLEPPSKERGPVSLADKLATARDIANQRNAAQPPQEPQKKRQQEL